MKTLPVRHQMAHRFRRHYAAIACVLLVHAVLLWALFDVRWSGLPVTAHELQVNILSPNLGPKEPLAPPLDWQFEAPQEVVVPEPEITVTPDQEAGEGIVATAITQRLAPRLDPTHLNVQPALVGSFLKGATDVSLMLRLLVMADGSVGNALVARSAGDAELDRTAISFVISNWKFLPASVNGKPIDAWMTVIVRFASG